MHGIYWKPTRNAIDSNLSWLDTLGICQFLVSKSYYGREFNYRNSWRHPANLQKAPASCGYDWIQTDAQCLHECSVQWPVAVRNPVLRTLRCCWSLYHLRLPRFCSCFGRNDFWTWNPSWPGWQKSPNISVCFYFSTWTRDDPLPRLRNQQTALGETGWPGFDTQWTQKGVAETVLKVCSLNVVLEASPSINFLFCSPKSRQKHLFQDRSCEIQSHKWNWTILWSHPKPVKKMSRKLMSGNPVWEEAFTKIQGLQN